jgi:hypothetical protein
LGGCRAGTVNLTSEVSSMVAKLREEKRDNGWLGNRVKHRGWTVAAFDVTSKVGACPRAGKWHEGDGRPPMVKLLRGYCFW